MRYLNRLSTYGEFSESEKIMVIFLLNDKETSNTRTELQCEDLILFPESNISQNIEIYSNLKFA